MEYEIVKTKHGRESLYVPSEKMLYVSKGRKNEYICYQHVLRSQKKRDDTEHPMCTSRVRRLQNGLCERANVNIPHSHHPNHEIIVSDKNIMESVIQQCQALQLDHPEDAHRIPNRHIFQRNIAKYEYCIETLSNEDVRTKQNRFELYSVRPSARPPARLYVQFKYFM